jgi:hypothetical protein
MPRARKASPRRSTTELTVEELTRLLAQMRSGDITPEDRDFVKRCLARYRGRYQCGYLSDRSARRLGLIEAQGKEQS